MSDSLTLAKKYAREKDEGLLYAGAVQEISVFEHAEDLILVITLGHLLIYHEKPFEMIGEYDWLSLTKIKYTAFNVQFYFGEKKYVCFSTDISGIMNELSKALQQVLTQKELDKIEFEPNYERLRSSPDQNSILIRINILTKKSKTKISDDTKNVLYEFIKSKHTSLSLSDFKKYHGLYTNADKRFLLVHSSDEEVNKSLIKKITIDTSPENVRKIFNEPELFDLAQKQLSISHDVEIPIESVKSLQEALDLLQKIFDLSNGCKPSKTEFLPLVDYLLLTSDIPDIYSFIKYLEHFLSEDICLNLIGNELFNSLTTFVNRVMQLDLKLTMC